MAYRSPDYSGGGLLNLIAELEQRLTGNRVADPLYEPLAGAIPPAATYVLVLFDGLGDHQLDHSAAVALRAVRRDSLDAAVPTTTSVNLATVATGLAPAAHGLIAHQLYLPAVERVVNTLKWTTPWGDPVAIDHERFLPEPNLWERLRSAGIEPITVQPGNFGESPLSRVLYRGCRFEPAWTVAEIVEATVQLSAAPGRLIFTYFPNVDVAAHVHGQTSEDYADALAAASFIWDRIASALPPGTVMVGTADHGLIDYAEEDKAFIPHRSGPEFYGDPRTVLIRGADDALATAIAGLPGREVDVTTLRTWLGPGPDHEDLPGRLPERVWLADPGRLLISRFMDKRLTGYHGGLAGAEMNVPLLVADSPGLK